MSPLLCVALQLQSLIEGMRTRNSELEGELAEAKAASTKILDHTASQMEGLRAEIQKVGLFHYLVIPPMLLQQ